MTAYTSSNLAWLPTDEDTNIYFHSIVETLREECGYSIDEAAHLTEQYYRSSTDCEHCNAIGIPTQNDEFFWHEGASGMALRIHYYMKLKLDPNPMKFIDWRTALYRAQKGA